MIDDRLDVLLRELETPVQPRREFGEALLARLEHEFERSAARRPSFPRSSRPGLRILPWAMAAVVVVVAATLVIARPTPVSAAQVVQRAAEDLTTLSQVRATLHYDINPDGSSPGVGRGATADVEVSYVRALGYRQEIVGMSGSIPGIGGIGSIVVWDGKQLGSTWNDTRRFVVGMPHPGYDPLRELAWSSPFPNWQSICERGGSRTFDEAMIAGRSARHVRCGDLYGGFWELWVDKETGFMLKIQGALGQGDVRLGSSAKGGFEVTRIDYAFHADPALFAITPPVGAVTVPGSTTVGMPALRATVAWRVVGSDQAWTNVLSYRDADAWRREFVEDSRPGDYGPGSFIVWGGHISGYYFGNTNLFSVNTREPGGLSPVFDLRTEPIRREPIEQFVPSSCVSAGREPVAARAADHFVCEGRTQVRTELWLDSETHLILRYATPYVVMEVRAIDYAPVFADGTFLFTPPTGARDVNAAAQDPYTQTSLRKSEIAPLWSGPLLDGSLFRLSDAQGQPLLILFWADWCPRGDPACDVLRQYDEISRRYGGRAGFVSVDIGGKREKAQEILGGLGYHFPVIVDEADLPARTWGVKVFPTWVLLDRDGRVVEVRLRPQTVEQLEAMLRGVGL